jgi:hypothetical protein
MRRKDPKNKKIVFYDTINRHTELKIRLQYDSISQANFFRAVVTGYIKKDPDILNFVDKIKASKKNGAPASKKQIKEGRALIKKGTDTTSRLGLGEIEIEDIFDILEQANPDL